MLRPILSPILKGILQPVLSAQDDVTRWVWTLNGMSYGVIPEAEFAGDYELTSRLRLLSADAVRVFGKELTYWGRLSVNADQNINARFDDSTDTGVTTAAGVLLVGVTHTLTMKKTGSLCQLFVDGIEVATHTSTTSLTITRVAMQETAISNPFQLLTFSATGITSPNYPSGTFNYKLDEPYSDSHIAVDSDNGVIMNKFNDLPEDYREVSV